MSDRERCSSCGKRRVVKKWFHVGGTVMGLLFPACRECVEAGWGPKLGRDYHGVSEEEFAANAVRVLSNAIETGQFP